VSFLDGELLADSPEAALPPMLAACGLPTDQEQIRALIEHPSIHKHSKNLTISYDGTDRQRELNDLRDRFGQEVDAAMAWAELHTGEHKLDDLMKSRRD
jgi:hypothetical protein